MVTSAYPSYSSCRQYRENLYDAVQRHRQSRWTGIRHYANHPGFVDRLGGRHRGALVDARATGGRRAPRLLFVTHSIPTAMAESAGPAPRSAEGGYVDWHRTVAAEVTRAGGGSDAADATRTSSSTAPGPARPASPGWSRT